MFYISYGCSFVDGPSAFRIPWGLQMLPAVILLFGLFLLPESPRYVYSISGFMYIAWALLANVSDGLPAKTDGKIVITC